MKETELKQIEEMAKVLCGSCRSTTNCKLDMCNSPREEAEALYNAGYRKQEWISVDERFPEEAGRAYLVWDNVQATVKKRFFHRIPLNMPVETYPYIREYFGHVSDYKRYTHWMPLPEAPKMKGDSHTEQWTFTILGDNGLPESFTKTVKKGGAE